jgi:hypothetical protein
MTTASSSILLALSPLTDALATVSTDDSDRHRIAQHTTLQAASTVDELIAMIPSDYRHVLHQPLLGVANTVAKLCAARSTLARWRSHEAAGTYPPHMRVRAPEVQLSKDFGEDDAGAAHRSTLEKAHQAYLKTTLSNSIQVKGDDVAFLEAALDTQRLYEEIAPAVKIVGLRDFGQIQTPAFFLQPSGSTDPYRLGGELRRCCPHQGYLCRYPCVLL